MIQIELSREDITRMGVDAIVNAANRSLLGGGGVDGAIHSAAGPGLLEECRTLNGCNTGQAKITGGHKLQARQVIHTVGPVWNGGHQSEDEQLRMCYLNSLKLALQYNLKSIAFPNISTGVYGFPKERAAEIAIEAVREFGKMNELPKKVIFALFDDENFEIYRKLFNNDLDQ